MNFERQIKQIQAKDELIRMIQGLRDDEIAILITRKKCVDFPEDTTEVIWSWIGELTYTEGFGLIELTKTYMTRDILSIAGEKSGE